VVAAHDPVIDPRLAWMEQGAPGTLRVHQLGVLPPGRKAPRVQVLPRGSLMLAHERQSFSPATLTRYLSAVAHSPAGMAGVQELLFIAHALQLPEAEFCELFGAPPQAERNGQFRWYLRYLLDTAHSLLADASRMRGVHAIIATDLDTLAPALVLKGLFGIPVLYDAHEYWPEADVDSFEYEKEFWVSMERRLLLHTDLRQGVSPGIAGFMAAQYGVPFGYVPNCEPADRLLPSRRRESRADGSCVFLFQGNFATGRGIELLIQAWSDTDPRAILQLRGPDNPFKARMQELAKGTGLLGKRIFFPDAVSETELVQAAAQADVGVVPYAPTGTNYRYCCPNKMSQYMAAGLPILANATEFVAQTVRAAGCGSVCDFSRRPFLVRAVNELAASAERRNALGQSGRDYFTHSYNWNVVSREMYARLVQAIGGVRPEPLVVYAEAFGEAKLRVPPLAAPSPAPVQASAPEPAAVVAPLAALAPAPAPMPASMPMPAPISVPVAARRGLPYRVVRAAWHGLPSPVRRSLLPVARRMYRLMWA
jgi:glycosyltransferase involved in cell wall biosynthesis